MANDKYKLEDLFTDAGPLNESEIVEAIKPFVMIQKDTLEIHFKETALAVDKRILVYGLAKKLLKLRRSIESELITAQEVHQKTGIKKGSIDPGLKKLKDSGFLIGRGNYEIPAHKISQILKLISKKA